MCDDCKTTLQGVKVMSQIITSRFDQIDKALGDIRNTTRNALDRVVEGLHQRELQSQDVVTSINELVDNLAAVFKLLSENPESVEKLNDDVIVIEKAKIIYDPSS